MAKVGSVVALFDAPTQTDDKEERARRIYALAALLQVVRAQHGWSVEEAAVHAGIGHMTWRRAEQGVASRLRTYSKLDNLLGLPPGTVNRATRSDELFVELAERIGVDTSDAEHLGAREWVRKFAEGAAASSPAGRVVSRAELEAAGLVPSNPDLPAALAALAQHTPTTTPSDLQLATQLVERMRPHADRPEVREAISAVLKAVPAMIGVTVREAEEELRNGTTS